MSKALKIRLAITGAAMITLAASLVPGHVLVFNDAPHFRGVIVGTETHAVAIGYTNSAGFVAYSAALEQ